MATMKDVSVGGTMSEKGKYIGKFCIIIGGLILDPVTVFFYISKGWYTI